MRVVKGFTTDFIPSIDNPTFTDEYRGTPEDELLVIETDERARGYPLSVMGVHHIVNDEIDDVPVVVTYCPLCGTIAAYERRIENQEVHFEFGGTIVENNLLMRDEETGSEWKQSTGEALSGALAGESLDLYTAQMTTWKEFTDDHPDGVVLERPVSGEPHLFQQFAATTTRLLDHPAGREVMDALFSLVRAANLVRDPVTGTQEVDIGPFVKLLQGVFELRNWTTDGKSRTVTEESYDNVMDVFLREDTFGYLELHGGPEEWEATGPEDLTAKTRLLGMTVGDDAVGFAVPRVEAAGGVVQSTVGGTDVVVFAAGGELVAYEAPGFPFEPSDSDLFRGDGTVWDPRTGESEDSRSLTPLPASWTCAYAWQIDHGVNAFYSPETSECATDSEYL